MVERTALAEAEVEYHEVTSPTIWVRFPVSEVQVTRRQLARILRAMPPEAFQRVGVHNERGELTVEKLLTLSINHIPHHLAFLNEKRKALGLPAV